MSSTQEMREAWAPPCTGPFVRVHFHGDGSAFVRASTLEAFNALNEVLVKHDYKTRSADTGGYNCRVITGGTKHSLHAYAIAVDINWTTNPYGPVLVTDFPDDLIRDIEAIRTNSGAVVFRWGGRYSGNKDAMHFEIICTPEQLATGIKRTVIQEPAKPVEEDLMDLAGNPSWVRRQSNSRFPTFIAHQETDWNSIAVLSRDNARFDPPFQEGRKSANSEDGVAFGLWFRRFFNAGALYGFGEADGVFFLNAQNGTYDISKK